MEASPPATAAASAGMVSQEVGQLLARSAAFQSLPSESQSALATDMAKVAGFLADKGWLTAHAPARAKGLESKPDAVDTLKMRLAQKDEQVGKDFRAGALREGTESFGELVQKVDFPKFVGQLIKNVFQAVVDASIQQMQAYGEMLSATAKTVDQFAADHITDNQARDYVANRYPSAVEVDTSGEGGPRLKSKGDASDLDLGAEMGVEGGLDDEEAEQQLISGVKLQMAQQRQQLLATMVLLGINRIVVTDGHINAKVLFDMRATDTASSRNQAQMQDEQKSHAQSSSGWLTNLVGGYDVGTSHETTVASAADDRSDSRAALKAQLSGDVKVAFKSETFPLERMVDLMGIQALNQKAAPAPLRGRAAAVQPAAVQPATAQPAVPAAPAAPAATPAGSSK